MAEKAIIPFPSLPLDIVREIFELAALQKDAGRHRLALVSRLIQQWYAHALIA